jgi:acyl-CoA hydrolase
MATKLDEDKRSIIMSEIMTPEKVNFSGNIHGGYILLWIDRVAYACASRYSASYVVTLSVDQVFFKEPIYLGDLVTFNATVNYVGRTSMEVGIRIEAENLITGERRHTNTCYVTMVAVDKSLKPIEIKPLTVNTPVEKRRYREAQIRREMRISFAKEHQKRKEEQE